ncbi:hypothetical protein C0Z17_00150 [Trinickia caryophylli]|nr:hypothetical protein C0Z17_00150 [Trinickia caryophylli]
MRFLGKSFVVRVRCAGACLHRQTVWTTRSVGAAQGGTVTKAIRRFHRIAPRVAKSRTHRQRLSVRLRVPRGERAHSYGAMPDEIGRADARRHQARECDRA